MRKPEIEFEAFKSIPRINRDIWVTEKLDGTNATVFIDEFGEVFCASRNRWITPEDDNYGFARWVQNNETALGRLGPGMHRGEWWGAGIQHGYNQHPKTWSLFNAMRWCAHDTEPQQIRTADPRIVKVQEQLPECCSVVPVLYKGTFSLGAIDMVLANLDDHGSSAAPGAVAEGVVIYHVAGNQYFKKTLGGDGHKTASVSRNR